MLRLASDYSTFLMKGNICQRFWKLHRTTQNKIDIIIVAIIVVILKAQQILEQVTNTKDQGKNRNKKDPNRRDLITQKLFR